METKNSGQEPSAKRVVTISPAAGLSDADAPARRTAAEEIDASQFSHTKATEKALNRGGVVRISGMEGD